MKQKNKTRLARAAMTLLLALLTTFGAWAETVTFNFEDGQIPSNWTNDATYPWKITEISQEYSQGDGHSGTYCIMSGNSGVNSSSSSIEATFTFVGDGSISFLGGCWGEGSSTVWDKCIFYIDDVQQFAYGALQTWDTYTFEVEAGTHTFKWSFTKDSSVNATGDAFFVDDIVIDLGSASACSKPTGLSVELTPGNGTVASLSWTENGSATAWQICLNDDETNLIDATSNPYTLENLTPEQIYTAKVRACCDAENQSSWSNVVTFTPTNAYTFTVNDGSATNEYVPFYGYYADTGTKGQFIIPASTLQNIAYGTINKLTFYVNNSTSNTTFTSSNSGISSIFEVYMGEVDNTTFDGNTLNEWTSLEKVMNAANLEVKDHMMVVTLDTPYQYMGGNLLIGFNETTSGGYAHTYWYGVTANGASLGGYGDNFSQKDFLPKTTFDYTPGEAPSCPKPTGLTVNYTGGTTAEVSWTSDADNWQLAFVDGEGTITSVSTVSENPYTLTGLELGTTYRLAIRTVCGEGSYSEWTSLTSPVTFTTDQCMPEDMIVVNYTLNDEYGDGWNGNYILVVDENCNIVEQITLASGASATGTVKVCGSLAQFMWYKGNYPGEASWTFTDADGNVLFEGTGSTDMANYDVLYTIDLNPYSMPSDIEVSEIGPYSAKVAWTETGTATAWQIDIYNNAGDLINTVDADSNPFILTDLDPETEYYVNVRAVGPNGTSLSPCLYPSFTTLIGCGAPEELNITPYPFSSNVDWTNYEGSYDIAWAEIPATKNGGRWMQYDNGTAATSIGGSTASEQSWGVMYPPTMTQGYTTLSKIAFYVNTNYHTNDITVNIYQGENPITGTLQGTQTVTPATTSGMMEVTLDAPLTIDPTQNLWITLTTTGTYVKTACSVTEPNDRWVLNDGAWVDVATLNENLAGYGWMIRGYVEDYDSDLYTWNSETGIEPPYTIENLNAETTYIVKVKAACGTEWKWAQFTTPSACDAPIDLAATDVTADAATLSWTGYQDSYNVQYREAAKYTPIWEDDFENGLDQWTIAHGDDATAPTSGYWYTINPVSGLGFEAHSGSYAASSWSWNSSAYNADNWLITPQLDLQGTLRFFVRTNTGYPDSYEVLLSTGDNAIADFTGESAVTLQAMAPAPAVADWTEVTIDLSAYQGQQGYIAIHHVNYDMNYLLIDDFGIYNVKAPGSWTTKSATSETLDLTGLTPDTEYEWQVQGVNTSCDDGVTAWSGTSTFTTWGVENINFAAEGYATYYNSKRDVILPAGMKAHVVTAGGATLTYAEVADGDEENNVVPAGTAMLLQVEPGQTPPIYLAKPSVAAYAGTNLLHGSDVDNTETFGGAPYYKLTYSNNNDNFGWYWGADNGGAFESPAHKAWLALGSSGAPFLGLPGWEDTTGIVPVGVNPEDGEWYTLQGMKVGKKPTTKGVYIHNGRKVLIP